MKLTIAVLLSTWSYANGQEGGAQTCVSTYAQATCMGPWFGWNEPTHLNQGDRKMKNWMLINFLNTIGYGSGHGGTLDRISRVVWCDDWPWDYVMV